MTQNVEVEHYLFGRCHLLAYVLAKMSGNEIECLWDNDYWHEEAECPSTVLVHAYVVTPEGIRYDAGGVLSNERLEEDYEWNESERLRYSTEEMERLMKEALFDSFEKNEEHVLREWILQQEGLNALL